MKEEQVDRRLVLYLPASEELRADGSTARVRCAGETLTAAAAAVGGGGGGVSLGREGGERERRERERRERERRERRERERRERERERGKR